MRILITGASGSGTSTLGRAVWLAINEPRPDHPQIIEALLKAGANLEDLEPTGHEHIDAILRRHGAV